MSKMDRIRKNKLFISLMSIIAITIIFMIITFDYVDLNSLTAWAVNFWDAVFDGRLIHYYEYTTENLRGAHHEVFVGNYLEEIPLALWDILIYLTHPVSKNPLVTSTGCLAWARMFYVFMIAVTAVYMNRICLLFKNAEHNFMKLLILMLGSAEILISCFYAGQNEIVYIAFFIMALYYFFEKKQAKFLICSIITISLCPIMMLPYIILIVAEEKKIWKIIVAAIIPMIPTVIFTKIYCHDKLFTGTNDLYAHKFDKYFMVSSFRSYIDKIPFSILLVIVFLGIFVVYFLIPGVDRLYTENKKSEFDEERNIKIIGILAVIMVLWSFLAQDTFYRSFLYLPFLVLYLMIKNQYHNYECFFLMLLNYSRTYITLSDNQNMYPGSMLKNGFVAWLMNGRTEGYICLYDWLGEREPILGYFGSLFISFTLFLVIIMFILAYKKKNVQDFYWSEQVSLTLYVLTMPVFMMLYYLMLWTIR